MANEPQQKTLAELSRDMYARADGLAHLTAKAEMERRRTQWMAMSVIAAALLISKF